MLFLLSKWTCVHRVGTQAEALSEEIWIFFAAGIDAQNVNSYFVKHVCISKTTYRSLMVKKQLPESYLRAETVAKRVSGHWCFL